MAVNNTYFAQQAPNSSKYRCQFIASGEHVDKQQQ